jgi:membrane protease YdiL (CAAX protease family)
VTFLALSSAGGVGVLLAGQGDLLTGTSPASLLVINLSLAAAIPAAMLAVVAAHQLRPGWLGSVVARLRWRLFVPFGAIALVVTLASVGLSMLLPVDEASASAAGTVTWQRWGSYALVVLLTTPLQAAGEEYAFRGYLLQALGAWTRVPWVGILVTSALFALAHGGQNPALFVDRFAFGLLAGWLVWRTGGLEASIAFHAVNNVVTFLISAAYDQVTDTLEVSDIPWSYAVLDVASMAVLGLLVHLYLRRRPVRRRTDATP